MDQPDYILAPWSCQALLPIGRIGPSWSKLLMAGVHLVDFKIILTFLKFDVLDSGIL